MTALGKMLVFLVLVLTLVWNGLVVNAYVTRTNWKTEADKAQKRAVEAADSATKQRALLEGEREASEDARRVLREENARLYEQVNTLNKSLADLRVQYEASFSEATTRATAAQTYQANLDKLTKQVGLQTDQLSKREAEVNTLTAQANAEKVAADKARQAAENFKAQADFLKERVEALNEQVATMRATPGGQLPGPGTLRVIPAPEGFRGSVVRLTPPAERGGTYYVTFSPGIDAGVREGQRFRVSHGAKYLGVVTVVRADTKYSVGTFAPATPRPGPGDLPKDGDLLEAATQ